MKAVIVLTLLIATITGFPQQSKTAQLIVEGINKNDERIATGSIVDAIEDAKEAIQNAGLDPLNINFDVDYALPFPVLFNTQAVVDEMLFTGLSNIVIDNINYSILTNRLTFNIRLPLLELSIGKVVNQVTVFGSSMESYTSGRFAIADIRLVGNIRVNVGIITGISIRSISLEFSIGRIESELKIVSLGKDLSDIINGFLGVIVPSKLNEYSGEVNELLEIVATQVIEANL